MAQNIISWLGGLASIIGMLIAISQARKAESSAKKAETIYGQLVRHEQLTELTQLQMIFKKALSNMNKYGPASMPNRLDGIDHSSDAESVQEAINTLKELRSHFTEKRQNLADEFCDTVTPLLDSFAQASNASEMREFGKQIVTHLSTFLATLKAKLGENRTKMSAEI